MFRWGIESVFTIEPATQKGRYARVKESVREYLGWHPHAQESEITAHIQQKHEIRLSPPALCRIRQELGLSPRNRVPRAEHAKHRK